mmetsp:Transcript_13964/g.52147  ORF Transcript_13964/g.52147 Transcript_13964/m.52147 type:complete len:95 (+) Transcript_13964:272-556(+)
MRCYRLASKYEGPQERCRDVAAGDAMQVGKEMRRRNKKEEEKKTKQKEAHSRRCLDPVDPSYACILAWDPAHSSYASAPISMRWWRPEASRSSR